jgi:UDP-N-acetylmuramate dehydrogenase
MSILRILENVPLKPLTTFKVGGPARFFFTAETEDALAGAIHWADEQQFPFFLLGGGSNILVADEGFPGLVVKLGKGFAAIHFDNEYVTAGAAVPLPHLGRTLVDHGWGGFEFMCGIPGTVGGAVVMNAGTKSGEIKDVFSNVRIMRSDGTIQVLSCDEVAFGCRQSRFKKSHEIILSTTFALNQQQDPVEIRERVRLSLAERTAKQPRNPKNCGSVFKSTGDLQAWQLVDKAGFRGAVYGNAAVAPEHSNWIVNNGSATAADIKGLILNIQTGVEMKFRVHLEREVLFVPDDIL